MATDTGIAIMAGTITAAGIIITDGGITAGTTIIITATGGKARLAAQLGRARPRLHFAGALAGARFVFRQP